MIGFSIIPKQWFFDRPRVTKSMDGAQRRSLNKGGGLVRKTARRSMRKRKRPSRAGQPPSAHQNPLLKKLLFYAWDPERKSVVVGPVRTTAQDVPELMEKGGAAIRMRTVPLPTGRPATPAQRTWFLMMVRNGEITPRRPLLLPYTAHYRPRPFMVPALVVNEAKIAEAFNDSMR